MKVRHIRGKSMEPKDSPRYDRRESDKRLIELEAKMNTWNAKLTTIFACGVFFWGITSWFIYNKLDQVEETIREVRQLRSEVNLLNYQTSEQKRINELVLERFEIQQQNFNTIFVRLTRLDNQINP